MRNAIITSSDQKCEQFVLKDWMKSLIDNVDLRIIDVIILDYGLSPEFREALKWCGAIIYPFHKNGAIPTVRFLDTSTIIRNSDYDQVMTCDGRDLIFQQDISRTANSTSRMGNSSRWCTTSVGWFGSGCSTLSTIF